MRSIFILALLCFSISIFSQERLIFLNNQDSTLIVDEKTMHMQSPSGSLFIGKNAGTNEILEVGNTSIGNSAGYFNKLGAYNTTLGHSAAYANVVGSQNTYLGFAAGENAIDGGQNVGIGMFANRLNKGNQNVMIGNEVGSLSTNTSETVAIGYQAAFNNGGLAGTVIGYQAGLSNSSGDNLTAIGHSSGFSNTSGLNNTFLGVNSGYQNTSAGGNTFLGSYSGWQNTGPENTFVGVSAGANNTGEKNIIIGYTAGLFSKSGKENVFIGHNSGRNNDAGKNNVFLGFESGYDNENGNENVAVGSGALKNANGQNAAPDPNYCVAVGFEAGRQNYGDSNTFLGYSAGATNTAGQYNSFLGRNSGSNSQGNSNTFLGYFSGQSNASGSSNTYIGYNTGRNVSDRSGNVYIGNNVQGKGQSNELAIDNGNTPTPLISGKFDSDFVAVNAQMKISGSTQYAGPQEGGGLYLNYNPNLRHGTINALDYTIPQQTQAQLILAAPTSLGFFVNQPDYHLRLATGIHVGDAIARSWVTYSDVRIKSNIETISYGLETITQLKPVSYFQHEQDADAEGISTTEKGENTIGLIAQEVYKLIPEAVNKPEDDSKQLWSMNYEKLIPVLIKSIQELQAEVDQLKKDIVRQKEN